MNIIKPGDMSRLDTTKRFECPACGCIWDANASEYRREMDRNGDVFACECPTCKRLSFTLAE